MYISDMAVSGYGTLIAYHDPLILLQNDRDMPLHKVSDICRMICKNHCTEYKAEPARIIPTLEIHSYRNIDIELKKLKINQHTVGR